MLQKLRSNRNPEDTVFSELKKEFGKYFDAADRGIRGFLKQYPRPVFYAMLCLIFLSIIISFSTSKSSRKKLSIPAGKTAAQKSTNHISDGLDQILNTGEALREIISLKREMEAILSKKTLTPADSLMLEKAFSRLEYLNKSIK